VARATVVVEDELRSQLGKALITALEFSPPVSSVPGVDPRGKHREHTVDTDPEGSNL
jgi:hypothetical protein